MLGIALRRMNARDTELLAFSSDTPDGPDTLTQILLALRLDGVEYGRCVMREPQHPRAEAQEAKGEDHCRAASHRAGSVCKEHQPVNPAARSTIPQATDALPDKL